MVDVRGDLAVATVVDGGRLGLSHPLGPAAFVVPALRDALHLSLRTFENVSEGGIYSIGESFVPIEAWVSPSATA